MNPVSPGGSRYRDRSRQSSRTEELEDRSLNSRRSKSRNYDEEEKEDYGRKSRSRKKRMEEEIEDLDLSDEDHVRSSRKDRKKHSRNIRDSSDEDISEDEMEEDSKSLRLDKVKNRPLDLSDMRKFLTTYVADFYKGYWVILIKMYDIVLIGVNMRLSVILNGIKADRIGCFRNIVCI